MEQNSTYNADKLDLGTPEKIMEAAEKWNQEFIRLSKETERHGIDIELSMDLWRKKFNIPNLSNRTLAARKAFLIATSKYGTLKEAKKVLSYNLSSLHQGFRDMQTTLDGMRTFLTYEPTSFSLNNLNGMRWYAYFLYYPQKANQEATLGRAVISVKHRAQKKIATLTNTALSKNVHYEGQYISFANLDNGIIVFNLNSDKEGRQLHIKVHCVDKKQQILIGNYLTYEDGHIQSGSILLENIPAKVKKPKPGAYSYKINPSGFLEINPTIRSFFSLKNDNYSRVFHDVQDLDSLQQTLDEHNPHGEKNTWFLEKNPPEIFIAAPLFASLLFGHQAYEDFLANVVSELQKSLHPHAKINFNDKEAGYDENGKLQPINNLYFLKTQRIFILLLGSSDILSFSMVQLGWALAYCKKVILVCDEKKISERFQHFDQSVLEIIHYDADMLSAWTTSNNPNYGIRERLLKTIRKDLSIK